MLELAHADENALTALSYPTRKREGGSVKNKSVDELIVQISQKNFTNVPLDPLEGQKADVVCPRCRANLVPLYYEEVMILQCPQCRGMLVEENQVGKILARREMSFSGHIQHIATMLQVDRKQWYLNPVSDICAKDGLVCPRCRHSTARMMRRFYSNDYRVEIDKCIFCGYLWFDSEELEILQCLVEMDSDNEHT